MQSLQEPCMVSRVVIHILQYGSNTDLADSCCELQYGSNPRPTFLGVSLTENNGTYF